MSGRLHGVHKTTAGRSAWRCPTVRRWWAASPPAATGAISSFRPFPGNNIWRVTPKAGGAVKLTSGFVDCKSRMLSRRTVGDAQLDQTGPPSLWRVSIEGGEPTALVETEYESFDALPSPNGRLIYYSTFEWEERPERERLLRWIVMSASDRKRLFAFNAPAAETAGVPPAWAPDDSGLDYVVTRNGISNIWRQPLTARTRADHAVTGRERSSASRGRAMANGCRSPAAEVISILILICVSPDPLISLLILDPSWSPVSDRHRSVMVVRRTMSRTSSEG